MSHSILFGEEIQRISGVLFCSPRRRGSVGAGKVITTYGFKVESGEDLSANLRGSRLVVWLRVGDLLGIVLIQSSVICGIRINLLGSPELGKRVCHSPI